MSENKIRKTRFHGEACGCSSACSCGSHPRGPSFFMGLLIVVIGVVMLLDRFGYVAAVDKLDYVEAQDDYVALKTEGRTLLKQQTISNLEAALDPARFVRIHRSYVVNLDRIAKIEPYSKDSKVAVLTSGAQLPVSRSGQARLKALLRNEA